MATPPDRGRSQTWRTFVANHMAVSAACDFFVVPTLTFKLLYCFLVLSHDRRRIIIIHVNVTRHPTDQWTAQQIIEAFPGDGIQPRFLHRDRDSSYGFTFRRKMAALGIDHVVSAKQSPWQNPFAERAIGSIRRQESRAPSESQTVRLPRLCRPASHSGQLRTRYRDFAYLYWLRFGYFMSGDSRSEASPP